MQLASQIVLQYHGGSVAAEASEEWQRIHSQRLAPDDMPLHVVPSPVQLFRVMVEAKLVASSSEAKRLVQEGGVRLDGQPVKDPNHQVVVTDAGGVVLQVGRRKFARLVAN